MCNDPNNIIKGQKYQWVLPKSNEQDARHIAHEYNLSYAVASILFNRGYTTRDLINDFLLCELEQNIASSRLLKDAERAAHRIIEAIDKKEKILVFGDYDVDGITASSIVLAALLPMGANINYYLPSRQKDGYGLSSHIVEKAHKNNYNLIITVDNGITAIEAANKAYELGMELIITDHHRPHNQLPKAEAIINPNQQDCVYPFKELAGVGVVFKLITLIYEIKKIEQIPNKIYELLMLGTIADIVPLVKENRYWVRHGLSKTKERSYALTVLSKNANLNKERLNSLDIGFMIAPQINSLGRISNPRDAVKFLISSNTKDVENIGTILKNMNDVRKKLESSIYQEIEGAIINKSIDLDQEGVIFAASKVWPPGIIGLVAGKLMQNYGRPAFLFHLDNGIAKGSCRSIEKFNIFDALEANKEFLISFGGHSFAAGLKLEEKNLGELKKKLEQDLLCLVSIDELMPKIKIDADLNLTEINNKLWSDLQQLEPFGSQNPQPAFLIKNVTLLKQPTLLKDKHVKCNLFSDGVIKPVIFFNRPDLIYVFRQFNKKSFHIAAYITQNEWAGESKIELQGIDVSIAQ